MQTQWRNLSDPVFHFANERPGAAALIEGGRTTSYRDLAALVGAAAAYLREIGVEPGQRVGISLSNCADHLILALALMRVGAVMIDLPWFNSDDLRDALIAKFKPLKVFLEADAAAAPGCQIIRIDGGWQRAIEARGGDWRYDREEPEPYVIGLTGGSTGEFKGVIKTHAQLLLRCRVLLDLLRESDVLSIARPPRFVLTGIIAGSAFMQWALSQFFVGGAVVFLPGYLRSMDLIRAIASWGDVTCFVLPTMCRWFIECAPQQDKLFPEARALVSAGLPLAVDDKIAMLQRVTPNFYELYGSSGSGPISVLHPADMLERADSVGRAGSLTEIEIVDRNGSRRPPGAVGELRCRGPAVSRNFADIDAMSRGAERFADGWYYPGDLAFMDAAGFVYLKGRVANVIERRGVEIFPDEIEAVLTAHPLVRAAAVVGAPGPGAGSGEELVAFVVSRGELTHNELALHCTARLPPEKRPTRVYYLPHMPVTANGKVDLAKLKALARSQAGG